MAIGERIHFFRCLRGLTQKHLGTLLGFPEKSADIRVAQYEMGDRTPRSDLTKTLSDVLDVSPLALDVPNIDSYLGLMHTLFAMEDLYGMTAENRDGEVVLRIDPRKGPDAARVSEMVHAWAAVAEKYRAGEIGKEEYDKWRYRYPQYDKTRIRAEVPSKELTDSLTEELRDSAEEQS